MDNLAFSFGRLYERYSEDDVRLMCAFLGVQSADAISIDWLRSALDELLKRSKEALANGTINLPSSQAKP